MTTANLSIIIDKLSVGDTISVGGAFRFVVEAVERKRFMLFFTKVIRIQYRVEQIPKALASLEKGKQRPHGPGYR